ncbi:MAG: cyclodeaminase/cyclohydrolase family protein [Deltaproteobacteria bacterium]|nr:cyclodeaminase/cyclohydrolase family protein [Deltaproteobacteria bacterium]
MLSDMKVCDLLEKTASREPVPGGGSMSALAAAAAAGLVEMVANLTIGRKGFEAVEGEMQSISREASRHRERFTESIDRDSGAYAKVMEAFHMPKNTEMEKQARSQAIQDALKLAAEVPLAVAEDVLALLPLGKSVIRRGNPNALTDGLVGVMLARSGALGALRNVRINLDSIKDQAYVSKLSARVREMETLIVQMEKDILADAQSEKAEISSG